MLTSSEKDSDPTHANVASRTRGVMRDGRLCIDALLDFEAALVVSGCSQRELARSWRCDERTVRSVLAGKMAFTIERLEKSPTSVRRSFYEARLRELDEDGIVPSVTAERHLLHMTALFGEFARAVHSATSMGTPERRDITRACGKLVDSCNAFLRIIRRS